MVATAGRPLVQAQVLGPRRALFLALVPVQALPQAHEPVATFQAVASVLGLADPAAAAAKGVVVEAVKTTAATARVLAQDQGLPRLGRCQVIAAQVQT